MSKKPATEHTLTGEPAEIKLLEDLLWEQKVLRWFLTGMFVGSFVWRFVSHKTPKCLTCN